MDPRFRGGDDACDCHSFGWVEDPSPLGMTVQKDSFENSRSLACRHVLERIVSRTACALGPEGRQRVAHGASRGIEE